MKIRKNMAVALRVTFFGLLMIGSGTFVHVAVGQPQEMKLTTTTTSSNKYGEGGTLETTSEKLKVMKEVWKDKNGQVIEEHDISYVTLTPKPYDKGTIKGSIDTWKFYKNGEKVAHFTYLSSPDNQFWKAGDPPVKKYGVSKADVEKWIEEIEKQFINDGTILDPWAPKEKEVETKVEQPNLGGKSFGTASKIDACLIGKWVATTVKSKNRFITGGGTGFIVTFAADGTQTIDYGPMAPFTAENDTITFVGKASATISTLNGLAKVEKIINAGVTMKTRSVVGSFDLQLPSLGPGGLGSALDDKSYKCQVRSSVTYHTSTSRDGKANVDVTLTPYK